MSALAASSNGVSFAVMQSAMEETKNAFMYGAEYKPDATSIERVYVFEAGNGHVIKVYKLEECNKHCS